LTSKYRARQCTLGERRFASQGEMNCFLHLRDLERRGLIGLLVTQVKVVLVPGVSTIVDFAFLDLATGVYQHAEFKGFETPAWRIKKKLWRLFGPTPLLMFTAKSIKPVEVIPPGYATFVLCKPGLPF